MSWNVYRQGRWIDRVWFTKDCDAEYVRTSLIDHDGSSSMEQKKQTKIQCASEEDVFRELGMVFVPPNLRNVRNVRNGASCSERA